MGKGSGLTGRSVQRYIRLTELIPELLNLVDEKKISLVHGVDLSYFDKSVQKWIYEYIIENGNIKTEQIAVLKEQRNLENMTQYTIYELLKSVSSDKKADKKVSFSENKLLKYFPQEYSASKCEKIIIQLLEKWKAEQKV